MCIYRNNGRQDITATLNGTVNGGKTYFNQSSRELIPNGSTVTEKGRIRDRSWSTERGQTSPVIYDATCYTFMTITHGNEAQVDVLL
ncbi:hypothetical protein PUN28_002021 [Cardiocondyla obscurior]|uniref:Uncharacterized protein n=1 Tax=Cardiocondyla obscurior TaxID=286306 RepID=A0AAW2GS72_9HYME